ncbi:MAG TPA: transposase, partial [Bacteroidota bacterium]|nr:transposase [Bacteroidota bacterium]
ALVEKCRLQKRHHISFVDYEEALERCIPGEKWLSDERIADLIAGSIRYRDGRDYDIAAYCVMPNHVHLVIGTGEHDLFKPVGQIGNLSNKPFSKIMQSLKRYTATQANNILCRSGKFWQDESYDHIVRDEAEFEHVVEYVIYNPVKAGLVKRWRDWKWTYSVFNID